jgi:hypothetical protein
VCKGNLNAISQYDHYAIYPDLEAKKEMIQEKIFALWREVHPFVGTDSYVIDFAYPSSIPQAMNSNQFILLVIKYIITKHLKKQ